MLRSTLIAVIAASTCPAGPPPPRDQLSLSFEPGSIDAHGQTATVTAQAIDWQGLPGTGSVTFSSIDMLGSFNPVTVQLSDSQAVTTLSCDARADLRCDAERLVWVFADWSGVDGGAVTRGGDAVFLDHK